MRTLFSLATFFILIGKIISYEAYDCRDVELKSSFSLLEPKPCQEVETVYEEPKTVKVQLFQMDDELEVKASLCRFQIARAVSFY